MNANSISDLKEIEKNIKDDNPKFESKLFIRKLAVLHFALDDIAVEQGEKDETKKFKNNSLLWIYKDEIVDNLYELFSDNDGADDDGSKKTFFEKSNAIWEKAVEWSKEELNGYKNKKIDNYEDYKKLAKLNNFLFMLANAKSDGLMNFDVPNVIYHGAPGTGKTYTTLQTVKFLCKGDKGRYKYCQFHPSYS